MTESLKCMDHLETDEGDFFCHLDHGHSDNDHQFRGKIEEPEEPAKERDGTRLILRTLFIVTWAHGPVVIPPEHKEG